MDGQEGGANIDLCVHLSNSCIGQLWLSLFQAWLDLFQNNKRFWPLKITHMHVLVTDAWIWDDCDWPEGDDRWVHSQAWPRWGSSDVQNLPSNYRKCSPRTRYPLLNLLRNRLLFLWLRLLLDVNTTRDYFNEIKNESLKAGLQIQAYTHTHTHTHTHVCVYMTVFVDRLWGSHSWFHWNYIYIYIYIYICVCVCVCVCVWCVYGGCSQRFALVTSG